MADKVKHWPSWVNWVTRDKSGISHTFWKEEPFFDYGEWYPEYGVDDTKLTVPQELELVEVDPQTPWQDSKQRRPE